MIDVRAKTPSVGIARSNPSTGVLSGGASHPMLTLRRDVKAFWKLSDVNDAVGSAHYTNNNSAAFAAGLIGNALSTTGTQFLRINTPTAALVCGPTDSFTMTGWFNMTTKTADRGLWGKGNAGSSLVTGQEFQLHWDVTTSAILFIMSDGTNSQTLSHPLNPTTGQWYFVVASWDAVTKKMSVSVNVGAATEATYTQGPTDRSQPWYIARTYGDAFMNGLIDAVGFWKRILSSTEQTWLYNSGVGREYNFS